MPHSTMPFTPTSTSTTTPTRTPTPTPTLPVELHALVISFLADDLPALRACALSHSSLRYAARPLLFRDITLTHVSNIAALDLLVASDPDLPPLIRSIDIHCPIILASPVLFFSICKWLAIDPSIDPPASIFSSPSPGLTRALYTRIPAEYRSLRGRDIEGSETRPLVGLLHKLSSIRSFSLTIAHIPAHHLILLISALPQLTHLDIRCSNPYPVDPNAPEHALWQHPPDWTPPMPLNRVLEELILVPLPSFPDEPEFNDGSVMDLFVYHCIGMNLRKLCIAQFFPPEDDTVSQTIDLIAMSEDTLEELVLLFRTEAFDWSDPHDINILEEGSFPPLIFSNHSSHHLASQI